MQALILAGGKGERMFPLTKKIPKVFLPIAGKPFLEYQINFFKREGINDFILATGYQAKQIKDYFDDGRKFGVKIIYSKQKKPLDTGGAIKNAQRLIKNKNILILNGDTFLKFNLRKMLNFHKRIKQPITITVIKLKKTNRFGQVMINKKNIITKFKEKDKKAKEGFINAGVYIFQKRVLREFPKNQKISLEREIFPKFINKISAFKVRGYFVDIGTPEDYKKAKKYLTKYVTIN